MIKGLLGYLLQTAIDLKGYLEWYYRKNSYDSVYFYTFHKCASVLFANYVLKNIVGLRHIDYANQIYQGKNAGKITFEKKGFVYGPIRLSTRSASTELEKLVGFASSIDFIQDKTAIFMIRDPRDILVSSYYSLGWSHQFSPVKEIRESQEQLRVKIQARTIDEYAAETTQRISDDFETVYNLSRACKRGVVIKYEDMVDDWDGFVKGLTKYIDIKPVVLAQIYKRSRPREHEDLTSHRRSGRTRGFEDKLKTETLESLNTTFKSVLERFQYKI
jgi:hypothetical protein